MRSSRKALPAVVAGLVLGVGLVSAPRVMAQGPQGRGGGQPGQQQGNRAQGGGFNASPGDLDKALQSYHDFQERSSKGPDQAKQEIERMVKELNELIQIRWQMAVGLAYQRAENPSAGGGPGFAGGAQGRFGQPGFSPGQQGQGQGQGQGAGGDHQAMARKNLTRELEQVQSQLRNDLEQARNQAEQAASQIRSAREQHRGGQGQGQAVGAFGAQGQGHGPGQGQPGQFGQNQGGPNQNQQGQPGQNQGGQAGQNQNQKGQAGQNQNQGGQNQQGQAGQNDEGPGRRRSRKD
jgi:hypothetical protein